MQDYKREKRVRILADPRLVDRGLRYTMLEELDQLPGEVELALSGLIPLGEIEWIELGSFRQVPADCGE